MKIIIIGDGLVGNSLAENLARDADNDVTIIDRNAGLLRDTVERLDVRCIEGNGLSASVLLEAGVRGADLIIAATSGDEMNMVCCLTAKKLGAPRTIARIRDQEYADELTRLKKYLELDHVINPEQAVAGEIAKLLEFPTAAHVEIFAKGRVEMVEILVTDDMPIVNHVVRDIAKKISSQVLIGALLRAADSRGHAGLGDLLIPDGGTVVHAGDTLYLVGQPVHVYRFCAKLGPRFQRLKNVMIAGGGRTGYYLAKYLDESGIKVKILEIDRDRCVELSEALPGALVINGNVSDDELLNSENLADMDGFISITDDDEDNLMTAMLAKHRGVKKVVAKIERSGYTEVIHGMGIDNIIRPKEITANHIATYVRGMRNAVAEQVETLYRVIDGRAEVLEFTAREGSALLNTPLRRLRLVDGALIAVIARGRNTIIPHGGDAIQAGDSVIVITRGLEIAELDDIAEVRRA